MAYLLNYNNWKKLHEAQLGPGDAEEYAANAGIDVKTISGKESSELTSGGPLESSLIDVVKDLEAATGYQFTATGGNDDFHQTLTKPSNHKAGSALDIVFKEATSVEARKKVETALINLMLSGKYDVGGKRLGGINEYDNPASHATGGHFHLSITPDNPARDAYECNLVLSGIKSYADIRKMKTSGTTTPPTTTSSPETSATTSSVQNLLSGKLLLKSGAKGEAVKEVQLKLKEKGFLTKEPNSEYDADTFNAVKEFQTNNKDFQGNSLKADGIVGPKTAAALFDQQPSQVVSSGKVSSAVQEVSPQITDYDTIVATVIDKLEGGYYHPDMLKDGRVKDSRYGASGETMMGIDRVAGGKLNDTQPGKEFWKMIDDAGASSKWKWNYRGGELEPKLRQLAGEIIKPQFEKLANTYLSEEARKIVFSDGRLLFHFVYATWNGSGWFKKFGKDVSDAVGSGVTNPDELLRIAIASRTEEGLEPGSSPNSLIAQGGKKIEKIVGLA